MKLTLQIRLLPDGEQKRLLLDTMKAFNEAATFAANVAFDAGVFSRPSIHGRVYYELRERFGLSSQMAVRAIGKAVECFQRDKKKCPKFRATGAMTYDERLMSFKGVDKVSLLTLAGRIIVPMVYGEYQKARFDRIKGQCDLVYRDGQFYLLCSIDLPEDATVEVHEFLGVDLGVSNIATSSDGKRISGEAVEKVRVKNHRVRRSLGRRMNSRFKRRTRRNARRVMRRIGNRESRFKRHVNHVIAKQIVATAKGSGRGIALEDLKGIRGRTRFRRKQRAKMGGWSFGQLRSFLEYKAKLNGVVLVAVNPRNTSRTCSQCGHCEKANRKNQAEFQCRACSFSEHADINAAANIAVAGALVNEREVTEKHRLNLVA